MTDRPERESSRRIAIFLDAFYLPHLDMALRMREEYWQRDRSEVRDVGLAEVRAFRNDLAQQINVGRIPGLYLSPE